MRSDDVEAIGRLGGLLAEEITGWVEQHHRSMARRAFRWVGPVAAPVRIVHDGVASGAYPAARAVGRLAGHGLGRALAPLASGAPVTASPGGSQAVAALDALLGDRLEAEHSPLALPMALRSRGRDLRLDPAELGAAFPGATSRVVVFVHGLGETDLSWLGRDDSGAPWSYAHAVEAAGWTGALVRYNTGRSIAANGASLAALLAQLVVAWPVPVDDLALVGHSMGGLVVRSACPAGTAAAHPWPALVRSCVYLGSPHQGAPIEQGLHALAWILGQVPEAGAVASVLGLRSAGIRDLRQGTLADGGAAAGPAPALLASARHHLVAAHLGSSGRHAAAVVLGDLLVRPRSALGLGHRRIAALDPCERATFPATSHFALLKDRRVAEALIGWLG